MRYWGLFFGFFAIFFVANGQISPPGLDDTRAAAWFAVGLSQQFSPRWQSQFYVGGARDSDPNDFDLVRKPAIYVLDLQNTYKFNDHWQLAGCISYRGQNRLNDIRTEVRYYARLYYRHNVQRTAVTWSFRPEYRTYFDHGEPWNPTPVEVRLRFKGQAAFPLNASRSNQLIVGNEWLTTIHSHTEDRLTTYFRHTFTKPGVVFDAGLMYQFPAHESPITHVAFDLIFIDPFNVGKKL